LISNAIEFLLSFTALEICFFPPAEGRLHVQFTCFHLCLVQFYLGLLRELQKVWQEITAPALSIQKWAAMSASTQVSFHFIKLICYRGCPKSLLFTDYPSRVGAQRFQSASVWVAMKAVPFFLESSLLLNCF
jgi:hypothetical protein